MNVLKEFKNNLAILLKTEDAIRGAFINARNYYKNGINNNDYKLKQLENLELIKEEDFNHKEEFIDYYKNFNINKQLKSLIKETYLEEETIIDLLGTQEYKGAIDELLEDNQELTQDYLLFLVNFDTILDTLVKGAYVSLGSNKEEYLYLFKNNGIEKLPLLKSVFNFLPNNQEIANYVINVIYKKLVNRANKFKYYQEKSNKYKYPSKVALYYDDKLDSYIKEGKLNSYDILVLSNVIETFYNNEKKFSIWQLVTLLNCKKASTGKSGAKIEITINSLNKLVDLNLISLKEDKNHFLRVDKVNISINDKQILILDRKDILGGKNRQIINIYFLSKCEELKRTKHNQYIDLKDVYIMLNHNTSNRRLEDREIIEDLILKYANKYNFSKNLYPKGNEEGIIDYSINKNNEKVGYWLKVLS